MTHKLFSKIDDIWDDDDSKNVNNIVPSGLLKNLLASASGKKLLVLLLGFLEGFFKEVRICSIGE